MVDVKSIFNEAMKNHYAIPAFNVVNPLMFKSVVEIASQKNVPIIVAVSEAHLDLFSLEEAMLNYRYYREKVSVPIILHLDHGQTVSTVKKAIDIGFPSVMIDASQKSFKENVLTTQEIVNYAKKRDVFVEAEIGHVGSNYGTSEADMTASQYTDVKDAINFVTMTDVDSLAVSVGTAHGKYQGNPHINFDRLEKISKSVDVPLVLHGGSSSGDDNLNKSIKFNISKINIFTDVVVAAMDDLDEIANYESLMKKIDANMKACFGHYIKVFETEKWSEGK